MAKNVHEHVENVAAKMRVACAKMVCGDFVPCGSECSCLRELAWIAAPPGALGAMPTRDEMLIAMSDVHSGSYTEAVAIADAILALASRPVQVGEQ